MPMDNMAEPPHPGSYIKDQVLPAGLSVKAAAELLRVGRPALSNLLNGKAALSPEMAARLDKTFGAKANKEKLMQMQIAYDQFQMRSRDHNIAVRAYVPSFLKITSRDIEQWVDGNIEARSRLPVLLRKLIHSTGQELSHVDFPGYDNAEKKGWDGRVDAGAATPWIPVGKSGWEFGCNEDPKQKADADYTARVGAIPPHERAEISFIFVTPRKWNTKAKWEKEKEALGDWKTVKVYDASDLEQWLEQSVPAQGWLAEQMGSPDAGAHSLDEQWQRWASVTEPELPKELFATSVQDHKNILKSWIEKAPASPLIVCADSKAEALAFLACVFDCDELATAGYKDRVVVFSSGQTLRKLVSPKSRFIPVVFTDEVEHELGGSYRNLHAIIVRPRNTVDAAPEIVLDLLDHEAFGKALAAMGIEHHDAEVLARESGRSPTILRRRLSKNPAIRTPPWTQNAGTVRSLTPIMLVGAWHSQSNADCEILSFLAGMQYSEIEKQIAVLLTFDDPPVWSVGSIRGISSKIDAFFAAQTAVTRKDLDDFLFAAEVVLSERDPALELPEDKRMFAGFYGKTREHSGALRQGVCETLVLLAVHGNNLFRDRLGMDVEGSINLLIRRLLTPLTPEKLFSQISDLPNYAEAAPDEFLRIVDEDLQCPEPQIYSLMKPADSGPFSGCPRTGLLWALENLAWKPERLLRVSKILAKLSERKIADNWTNKPDNSLRSIFRSWMPQTAASLEERMKALETLIKLYPASGWHICLDQIVAGQQFGHYNHRPRWRTDAAGVGRPVGDKETYEFCLKALDLALRWPNHNEKTLGDLIGNLLSLSEEDQSKVWDLIDGWAKIEQDDGRRAVLRERIRRTAFTRRGKRSGIKAGAKDRARAAYALLAPHDIVVRHHWLFAANWVEESSDELEDEDFDYNKRDERIRNLRVEALREVWTLRGVEGVKAVLAASGAAFTVGWHLADGVIETAGAAEFLKSCLALHDSTIIDKMDELVSGFLRKMDADPRREARRCLIATLPPPQVCRLLKCSPFERETWLDVDSQQPEVREQYWREVGPTWMMKDSPDLNEMVDRMLEAKRPRAAFLSVHFSLEELETSRLKRLMQEIATCASESTGTYQVDSYYISSALDILQGRGLTEEEMGRLEFLYIRALDHSQHGIPSLERQLSKSPSLFIEALALTFKRDDGGEDPPEWRVDKLQNKEAVWSAMYALLDKMKRFPGTRDDGTVSTQELRAWITEVRSLCLKYGRVKIGDQRIGQILSGPMKGGDGIWPCEAVREVLEEIGSPDIAIGMGVGVYNSRGVHARGEGGDQERDIANKYRSWSRQLVFDFPYVADLVEQIAATYDREAAREDSQAAIRRRLT